jgi:hypothetical protein
MPLDRDSFKLVHNRPGEIKMPRSLYDYRDSHFFDETYWPADANGNKYIDPGLICALAAVADDATYGPTYKIVPYEPGGTYGVNSYVARGVLDIRLNATLSGENVALIYHGQLQERNCYVLDGSGITKDNLSATIKTALPDIDWV